MEIRTVDVLIPTCRPDEKFIRLLAMLENQTYPVRDILVANTNEAYWKFDNATLPDNMKILQIEEKDFDHGGTRRMLAEYSDADYVVFMTQDAVPADDHLIEELLRPFSHPLVKAVYARQLPDEKSRPIERYTRSFNYPDVPAIKDREDLGTLGVKTFFCSNVCAAYEKRTYTALGGFVNRAIFNEDMIYGAKLIEGDFCIAYAAQARVIHSHNYTWRGQMHRNFDLGVSQADHPEIFKAYPSEGEGIRLVKQTAEHLWKTGQKRWLFALFFQSAFKYAGYLLGKHYRILPRPMVRALSMNKNYWKS